MSLQVYGLKAYRNELFGKIRDIRVTWLLEELGTPFEHIVMDPTTDENRSESYLKINPTGKVPAVVDDGFALFESAAICEYLAAKHGRFLPQAGTPEYFIARQWSYFVLTNLDPQCSRVFAAQFFLPPGESTDTIGRMAYEALPRFLQPLNERLSQQEFMLKDGFSVTDIYLVTALNSIDFSPVLKDYPALFAYWQKCIGRPAFKKAAAKNGVI